MRFLICCLALMIAARPAAADHCTDLRRAVDDQQVYLFQILVDEVKAEHGSSRTERQLDRSATIAALAVNVHLMLAAKCDTTGIVVESQPHVKDAVACSKAIRDAEFAYDRALEKHRREVNDEHAREPLHVLEVQLKGYQVPACRNAYADSVRQAREKAGR